MGGSSKPSLKETAEKKIETNPTQLGDPVSLKAETSNTKPTEHDRPIDSQRKDGKPSLKEIAEKKIETNPTQLGDPVSLKAETSDNEPTDQDRGSLSKSSNRSGKPKI